MQYNLPGRVDLQVFNCSVLLDSSRCVRHLFGAQFCSIHKVIIFYVDAYCLLSVCTDDVPMNFVDHRRIVWYVLSVYLHGVHLFSFQLAVY